ncbi:NAD-dependent epimerase/dehydratase family protein [Actinoallomurus sp. CA-150999]|uniref:NAD-dependent epimerase/dehydratase family protein n=1 Tax=Actinoallomurus sp. CA-150999 TaxID=3239887 RepID=UPI003D916EDE
MKRTVVLGGTGYVGRHVCAALTARGHDVLVVARTPGDGDGLRFAAMDVAAADPGELVELLRRERPTAVVNSAGGVWNVTEAQMLHSNVRLVEHLAAALAALEWRPRLVHLGSVHEYAPVPAPSPIDERTPTAPATLYGRTKLRATEVLLAARHEVDCTVLRVSNMLGPGAPRGSLPGLVAERLRTAAAAGERAVLRFRALGAQRDFVDVRDVAGAVAECATAERLPTVINIGRGEATCARTLVELLIKVSGVPADLLVEEGEGPDPADRQQMDISVARALLGWIPSHGLEDSVRALWGDMAARVP